MRYVSQIFQLELHFHVAVVLTQKSNKGPPRFPDLKPLYYLENAPQERKLIKIPNKKIMTRDSNPALLLGHPLFEAAPPYK